MLQRIGFQNHLYDGPAPEGALALERDGHYLLRGEFAADEVAALREDILAVYTRVPADPRAGRASPANAEMFRYEMFNRSEACQRALARPAILAILEPLIGDDCHAISCTAWKNDPGNASAPNGQEWHVDGGPHVPRKAGTYWPAYIPYPIFVIAVHVFLQDVELADGPTAFVPRSHTSGTLPPHEKKWELELEYQGRASVTHLARAGDVGFFVSDVWHRRLPPEPHGKGRFFLQTNYGRREIAQRVRPSDVVNHATAAAIARARTERERRLIGLHPQAFYDG
ncbi:MAG: phytanoyl-CoA dioxygenase family protein [Planctomycetes bacterium]|nr:phytanoyl-CoA dioxygenase family protein [Planctomycetota bacterium]